AVRRPGAPPTKNLLMARTVGGATPRRLLSAGAEVPVTYQTQGARWAPIAARSPLLQKNLLMARPVGGAPSRRLLSASTEQPARSPPITPPNDSAPTETVSSAARQ